MKRNIFICLIGAFTLLSCDDFLTLEPEYQISDQSFYKDKNDFEALIMGCYSGLQSLHNGPFQFIAELTTDNAYITVQSPGIHELECDEMNLTSSNSYINSYWSTSYRTIARCNNLINRADESKMTDQYKAQYKGEAYFIRAFCYFNLVRTFGEIPLVVVDFRNPEEAKAYDMTRRPVEEIDKQIEKDLSTAVELLSGVSLNKGRGSVGAAKALLGRYYLTRKKYADVISVLKEVIESNQYTLVDDYEKLFTKDNDDLPESIFEIKFMSGNVGEGNSFAQNEVPTLYGGMSLFPGNQLGGGRLSPTTDIVNAYEEGDKRKDASVSDSIPMDDGTVYKMWYGKKFVDFTASVITDMDNNFTILRYADVLLMYAEALNESGNSVDAHSYLNMVRKRAGLNEKTNLSKEEFILAMEKERRVEFLHEGHRWYDLVRTGRAKTVLNQYFTNEGKGFTVEDYELLMPVPQRERDIDPNLSQNPGY